MNLAALKEQALGLPAVERALLAEWIWDSLEEEAIANRKRLWAQVAEERINAFDQGELSAVDGPSAIRQTRQSLRR
jgi:putative addiction module component (TIGR02574 family)